MRLHTLSPTDLGIADRLVLGAASSRQIDGLWVGGMTEEAINRVAAALELIKIWDPLRYRRLPCDIDRVFVTVITHGHSAQFRPEINACELDERFVLDEASSPALIASVIVHEATHARLDRLGFAYEADRRVRIERVCRRRELAFLGRLPNKSPYQEQVELALAQPDDMADWLTDQAFAQRREAGAREALRYLGVPDWLSKLILRLRRRSA